tara:strand:- start:371 stop:1165 length:795 start_codon:yes stop_codon:yes gene_type:complete
MGIEVVSLDRDLPDYDKKEIPKKYQSDRHIQEDILTWDYKQFPNDYFTSVSFSPVCLWSSQLRYCWINCYYNPDTCKFSREPKDGYVLFTKDVLQDDIDRFMKPQVDKCFEIIEYFKEGNPDLKWWIENPKNSTMKDYVNEKYPQYDTYTICDYCKYGFPYQKSTRFWNNFNFQGKTCNKDCNFIVDKLGKKIHSSSLFCNTQLEIDGKWIRVDTKEKRLKYKKEVDEWKKKKNLHTIGNGGDKETKYRIPPFLISSMLNSIYI